MGKHTGFASKLALINQEITIRRIIRHLLLAVAYGLLGTVMVLVGGYVWMLEQRPDLKPWQEAVLDAEFRADSAGHYQSLDDYLAMEERLFRQLQEQVYDRVEPVDQTVFNRYSAGSVLNPQRFPGNWNHTFQLPADNPVGGVVALHGLSDSPYSMRALSEHFAGNKLRVTGLRLPGHGTAPSGLLNVSWQDQAAAVRLAVRDMRRKLGPDLPIYLAGYSNGAALAVEYVLAVLEGEDLPAIDGLVLLSPAIGVSPVAALAIWQARLSNVAGLKKLAWNDLLLEIDPYKYNSFTVNAGDQIYRLTGNIANRIQALNGEAGINGFPPTIAFQSVVDATIPAETLIDILFMKLGTGGHELVLFDVNRNAESEALLRQDPEVLTTRLFGEGPLPFGLSLLTNAGNDTNNIVVRRKRAGEAVIIEQPTELAWPKGLFSLSHVALPFPPDDPLYGGIFDDDDDRITLGSVSIRGERNLLQIPDNYFLRLRYNPFFSWLAARSLDFIGSDRGHYGSQKQ
ncbi:MAG: alpha/beta fold hydrolase [Pseudomonadota bacterium]